MNKNKKIEVKSKLICLAPDKLPDKCLKGHTFLWVETTLNELEQQAIIEENARLVSKWECPNCKSIILKIKKL